MFKLRPSKFDAARQLTDKIVEQGWIWRGRQKLDGLCCLKSRFASGDWIEALCDWLDYAKAVYENDDYIVLVFEDKVEVDCDELGRCLPLKHINGALSSFPLSVASADKNLSGELEGALMVISDGQREIAYISAFETVDIGGWWAFNNVQVMNATALPTTQKFLKGMSPGWSTPFDQIAYDAGVGDLRKRLERGRGASDDLKTAFRKFIQAAVGSVLRFAVFGLITLCIVFLMISWGSIVSGLQSVDLSYLVVIALVAYVIYLIRSTPEKLIGPESGGQGGGSGQGAGADGGEGFSGVGRPFSNLFVRAAGWLFWNSSLGSGVRNKYSRRIEELEKLFEKGETEEALRQALSLGASSKPGQEQEKKQWFGDYPFSGPQRRDNLDIPFQDMRVPSYGILSEMGYEGLEELYRRQAETLLEREEFDHAAFIYVELLGDVRAGVEVFEKKGDFRTAAKLAQGRRLEPTLFIPLWFKAGEKQLALKLAAQYSAFRELHTHIHITDPFYKELALAWAMRLAETKEFSKALEISESVKDIGELRNEWMIRALEVGGSDPDTLARTIRCYPDIMHPAIQSAVSHMLEAATLQIADARCVLAEKLAQDGFERIYETGDYMTSRLPLLAAPLIRKMMEDEAQFGSLSVRRNAAISLSTTARQHALRVDLRRLHKVSAKKDGDGAPSKHVTLRNLPGAKPIRDVVAVPGNRLLVAYENGTLQLLGAKGKTIWADQVHGVIGLIPIASGRSVFVVREELAGQFLSIIYVDDGRHEELGASSFRGFHSHATETGWMVHIENRVCMLDVQSLIKRGEGQEPEQHWAVPIMEAGYIRAYLDEPHQASFIFERKENGLTEEWVLDKKTLKVTSWFTWLENNNVPVPRVMNWAGSVLYYGYSSDVGQFQKHWFRKQEYSLKEERRLLATEDEGSIPFKVEIHGQEDTNSAVVYSILQSEGATASSAQPRQEALEDIEWVGATTKAVSDVFRVTFPEVKAVKTRLQPGGGNAVIFDNTGRVVLIDIQKMRVLYKNA